MYVKIITDLVTEPVSLADAKKWMRVEYDSDDTLITALIKSTRTLLESYTGLSFGTKTIETVIDITKEIQVPYSPLQTMTSVYRRENNAWVLCVVDLDYYIINNTIQVELPALYKLTYTAGYTTLPEPLKTDIKVMTAWQYENRGIKFDEVGTAQSYPFMNLLNARNYRQIVI